MQTWGDVLIGSFQQLWGGIISFIPKLIIALIIFIAGYFLKSYSRYSTICENPISPAPFGSFAPAQLGFVQPGLSAEWFVAPGAFNMPEEVFIAPDGGMLVSAVRGHTLYRVSDEGDVSIVAEKIPGGYLGDIDSKGDVYLHNHYNGEVMRISSDGQITTIVQSSEIRSDCDSGFGLGPDGNFYLALNHCSDKAALFRITLQGKITKLADDIVQLQAIRSTPDGRLIAASWNKVYEISLSDYSLYVISTISRAPFFKGISPGGLAVDTQGNIYVSTGSRSTSGEVYRLDSKGKATLIANIPQNGLSGIEWLPSTGEIVGGQIRQGGLLAVGPNGAIREIVPGNGLVTPMGMAFSPCGELAVGNDDGGMMALVDPQGRVSWFFDYISFTPPVSFVEFAPDGRLYTSEAAPSLQPVRVASLSRGGQRLRTFADADMPSGLARRRNGAVIIAETGAGRITQVNPDRSKTVLAEGLTFPQALALDAEDNLYVVTGMGGDKPLPGHMSTEGDTILRITPDGIITIVTQSDWVSALAVSSEGDLYATTPDSVARVLPDGATQTVVRGVIQPMGLAFDLTGNLCISDAQTNGILRLGGFPQGTIQGTVTDTQGQPIAGARVQILSDWPIVAGQLVTTDEQGGFRIRVAPRMYTVTISAEGFKTQSLAGIVAVAEKDAVLEPVLEK